MELETPTLEQTSPENDTYYYAVDFRNLRFSGTGDIEGVLISGTNIMINLPMVADKIHSE